MAGFEVAIFFDKLAVLDDGATNTGREGKVKAATFAVASLGKASEIGVIFDVNWDMKICVQLVRDIKIAPRQIAEPDAFVVMNNARHGDGDSFDGASGKIGADLHEEVGIELGLTENSGEFDGVENFALRINERNESFGAANVNTEIHRSIITVTRKCIKN